MGPASDTVTTGIGGCVGCPDHARSIATTQVVDMSAHPVMQLPSHGTRGECSLDTPASTATVEGPSSASIARGG